MTDSNKERKGYKYLYECDDCHTRQFIRRAMFNRAAKPHCKNCGCTRLEMVSEDAREDLARTQREYVESLAERRPEHRGGKRRKIT